MELIHNSFDGIFVFLIEEKSLIASKRVNGMIEKIESSYSEHDPDMFIDSILYEFRTSFPEDNYIVTSNYC